MKNLTVLRLHGLSGIQFTIPSFIQLINLKTLVSILIVNIILKVKHDFIF